MKSPKLLPWLANSSGLSQARVEQLWQEASEYAESVSGEVGTPRYWSLAHHELINRVDEEALANQPVETAPWLMVANHVSMGVLVVTDVLSQLSLYVRAWFNQMTHRPV